MTPPHDLIAEEALLGGLLLSTNAIGEVYRTVAADDFYVPTHQVIYDAVVTLYLEGNAVDPITVWAAIRDKVNEYRQADLISLQANAPGVANVATYARRVVKTAMARRVLGLGHDITAAFQGETPDPMELLDTITGRVAEIASTGALAPPKDLYRLHDFLANTNIKLPPWAVPGLIRMGWRCMVVAPEGSGKTTLFRSIAINAAQGLHPFTGEAMLNGPIVVLLVDLENPDDAVVDVCKPIDDAVFVKTGAAYDDNRAWLWHRISGINLRQRRDRTEFEACLVAAGINRHEPSLVAMGPVYKCYRKKANESDEDAAGEVQAILDDLRARYGFGLLLEHHAAKKQGGTRELDPYGTSLWLRWPELGFKLIPDNPEGTELRIGRFRRDRVKHAWPEALTYGTSPDRPWEGRWPDGTLTGPNPMQRVVNRIDTDFAGGAAAPTPTPATSPVNGAVATLDRDGGATVYPMGVETDF